MSEFEMWGPAASGARLAQRDAIEEFMKLSQAQEAQARAQGEQQKLAEAKKREAAFAQLVSNTKNGKMSEALADQAQQLMQLGQPVEAGKLMVQAGQVLAHEGQASAAVALERKRQIEIGSAAIEESAQLFKAATSQQEWDAANMMFAKSFPQLQNPFAGMPYSPENAAMAQRILLTEKDRLAASEKDERTKILRDNLTSLEDYRKKRLDLLAQRNSIAADRERRWIKNGGKSAGDKAVGSPSKTDIRAAEDALNSKLEFPLEKEDSAVAAYDIAATAKALVQQNKGMSMKEARERAVAEALKSGEFQVVSKLLGRNKMKYSGGGKSPETAIPIKKDMQFSRDKYYVNGQGLVAKFNGKGFEPVNDLDDEEGE